MSTRARCATTVTALCTLTGIMAATGCSGPVHKLRVDATPEVFNLAETPDEVANKLWITHNMNMRMISEDAARTLHLDRPTRLSPNPIPR